MVQDIRMLLCVVVVVVVLLQPFYGPPDFVWD